MLSIIIYQNAYILQLYSRKIVLGYKSSFMGIFTPERTNVKLETSNVNSSDIRRQKSEGMERREKE